MYRAVFSQRAEKAFLVLTDREARAVKSSIEKLMQNPRSRGTIRLKGAPVAPYRYRIGNLRILFDIDDRGGVIEVLDIRKRDERTYR